MKLTIIGAAGVRTPLIIDELIRRQDRLGLSELALMDINANRMTLMNAVASVLESDKQPNFNITNTTDAKQALDGADFVITTFRVGDMESRVIDELVPLELGVLGQETTGSGGFAMGLRTIPVLAEYCTLMKQVCPNAWLINFANPSGMMTEALTNTMDYQKAIGICDGPSSMLNVIALVLQQPPEIIQANYFGLNHLGWFKSIMVNGMDRQPELIRLLLANPKTSFLHIDTPFITSLGMIPNEYLSYYYHSRHEVSNSLKSGMTRGQSILTLNTELFKQLTKLLANGDLSSMRQMHSEYLRSRSMSYLKKEGGNALSDLEQLAGTSQIGYAELALDLIEGLTGGKPSRLIVNIQNWGSIQGMGDSEVVEIPAWVSRDSVQPVVIGEVPDECLGLMKQVKAFEKLTIQSAVEGSYEKAAHALTIHPLIGDYRLACNILDGYLTRHGSYFPHLG